MKILGTETFLMRALPYSLFAWGHINWPTTRVENWPTPRYENWPTPGLKIGLHFKFGVENWPIKT